MKTWTLNEAQTHLGEMVKSSLKEPQIIADQGQPVAALVDIVLFNEFMAFQQRPSMADLLAELGQIQANDPIDLEIPDRQDRPNPLFENMS